MRSVLVTLGQSLRRRRIVLRLSGLRLRRIRLRRLGLRGRRLGSIWLVDWFSVAALEFDGAGLAATGFALLSDFDAYVLVAVIGYFEQLHDLQPTGA